MAPQRRCEHHALAPSQAASPLHAAVITGPERRHGGFAVETSTRCIIELLQFKRRGAESIDEALSRFETCRMQAQMQAQEAQLQAETEQYVPGFQSGTMRYYFHELPTEVTVEGFLQALGAPQTVAAAAARL